MLKRMGFDGYSDSENLQRDGFFFFFPQLLTDQDGQCDFQLLQRRSLTKVEINSCWHIPKP